MSLDPTGEFAKLNYPPEGRQSLNCLPISLPERFHPQDQHTSSNYRSEPQFYLESNHRCGNLMMNHLLVQEGKHSFIKPSQIFHKFIKAGSLVTCVVSY